MLKLRPYQIKAVTETLGDLKTSNDPILLIASVGSGKSLMISEVVQRLEKAGKRVLCLVNNSELVRNNAKTYEEQGGTPSIFCATLNKKCIDNPVIFATPQSIISSIKKNHLIAEIKFNLIVVDEAHAINYANDKTIFMQILRHYKHMYPAMRLLGLTGTPFRGKGNTIVGAECLFKSTVGNIDTLWLIDNNYLVRPQFGYHALEGFDFSKCKIQNTGEFKPAELQEVINKNHRLTGEILIEAQTIMAQRTGAFVFCSTVQHCHEAMAALPDTARLIVGDTPDKERHQILLDARARKVKFLVSVNCLMVGIDVPAFDTIIWLRPTTSLVLYVQGIGRGLRLSKGKDNCLVLDYAGNVDRFSEFDNPIINEALQPTNDNEDEYVIPCQQCSALNKALARRCIGIYDKKRCDFFFMWKDCYNCQTPNDQTSRHCRKCGCELIDPNAKLKKLEKNIIDQIQKVKYKLEGHDVRIWYYSADGYNYYEQYSIHTEKSRNIFYAKFVRLHCEKPSRYYMHMKYPAVVEKMLRDSSLKTPYALLVNETRDIIKKKLFK